MFIGLCICSVSRRRPGGWGGVWSVCRFACQIEGSLSVEATRLVLCVVQLGPGAQLPNSA